MQTTNRIALLSALAISLSAACGDDDSSPMDAATDSSLLDATPDANGCSVIPEDCQDGCITTTPIVTDEDCCDSVTCYCDPDTQLWDVRLCVPLSAHDPVDAPIPASRQSGP